MNPSHASRLFGARRSTSRLLAVLVAGGAMVALVAFAGDRPSAFLPPPSATPQSTAPKPFTPLIDAVRASDVAKVGQLLLEGAVVDATDGNTGATALVVAVLAGNMDIAKMLLSHRADPNTQTKNGLTPLWLAASFGREDLVRLLLSNGADPNQKSPSGSPEVVALSKGHLGVVAALQEHGGLGSNIKVRQSTLPATPTAVEEIGDDPSQTARDYVLATLYFLDPQRSRTLVDLARPVVEKHQLAEAKVSLTVSPTGFEIVQLGADAGVFFFSSWVDPLAGVLNVRGDFPETVAFREGSAQLTRRDGQLAVEYFPLTELRIGARTWRYVSGKWLLLGPAPAKPGSTTSGEAIPASRSQSTAEWTARLVSVEVAKRLKVVIGPVGMSPVRLFGGRTVLAVTVDLTAGLSAKAIEISGETTYVIDGTGARTPLACAFYDGNYSERGVTVAEGKPLRVAFGIGDTSPAYTLHLSDGIPQLLIQLGVPPTIKEDATWK